MSRLQLRPAACRSLKYLNLSSNRSPPPECKPSPPPSPAGPSASWSRSDSAKTRLATPASLPSPRRSRRARCRSSQELHLWHNQIGDEGIKALLAEGNGGGAFERLTRLDLDHNDLSEEGVEALAEAIENGKLPSLGELCLRIEHIYNERLRAACEEHGLS